MSQTFVQTFQKMKGELFFDISLDLEEEKVDITISPREVSTMLVLSLPIKGFMELALATQKAAATITAQQSVPKIAYC